MGPVSSSPMRAGGSFSSVPSGSVYHTQPLHLITRVNYIDELKTEKQNKNATFSWENRLVAKMFVTVASARTRLDSHDRNEKRTNIPQKYGTTCVVVPDTDLAFQVNPDQDTDPNPDSDLGF